MGLLSTVGNHPDHGISTKYALPSGLYHLPPGYVPGTILGGGGGKEGRGAGSLPIRRGHAEGRGASTLY